MSLPVVVPVGLFWMAACSGPTVEPSDVAEAPAAPVAVPAPDPEPELPGSEPLEVLLGNPYSYDPGYHGSWSQRVSGRPPYDDEDVVEIEFGGLPVDGEAGAWRFTLEKVDLRPSSEGGLDLAADSDATATVRRTADGFEVSTDGLAPDLEPIVEGIVTDLFLQVPSTPRGVGGTWVSDVDTSPGKTRVQEHTQWTFVRRPAEGVVHLEGAWVRTMGMEPGWPSEGPAETKGKRSVSTSGKGVFSSSRYSVSHHEGVRTIETVRVSTGRQLN